MRFSRRIGLWHIVAISLLFAAVGGYLLYRRERPDRSKVYVVGYESVPPYQIVVRGQPPSGLSVDLVREAAKQRSIQLRWVHMKTGSENALRSGQVDLWTIMTVLERRKAFIHFTNPYLESSDFILVRSASRIRSLNDLEQATFSLLDLQIHRDQVRHLWPSAQLLSKATQKDALDALCKGESDAVFLNERSGLSLLLEGGGCPDAGLRILSLGGPANVYAIASTFESAAAADELRAAISDMAASGQLADIFNRYGYFSRVDLASIEELTHARRSRTRLLSIVGAMTVVLVLVIILSRRLHLARVAAERANAAKTIFLANMSHEIRTPISGVLGLSRELSDAPLPPEEHHLAVSLHQSAESLLTVIDDILDLSKVEAGHLRVCSEPFDLLAAVSSLTASFRPEAKNRGLTLDVAIGSGIPQFVAGDWTRIRQVLSNLISNALKFTDAGSVRISLSRGDSQPLVRFSVSDTGIGIPEDWHPRIFQPFTQVDPSYSRKRGGSGLGLTIAVRLVEAMKGVIQLESTAGKGSTFHVILPLPRATMTVAPSEASPDGLEPLRLLIAEDNPVNQLVAVRMVQKMGHGVDLVADGQHAIDAFRRGVYDLVLMDCQMPGIDGFEATRMIRRLENGRRTPIIAITAHAMDGATEQCLEAGMDDYLAKPLTREKLGEKIQIWCRKARAAKVR